MAVGTPVLLTSAATAVAGSSKATASITPTAGRVVLAFAGNSDADGTTPTVTCSGCGLTWTQVATVTDGFFTRNTLFVGTGTPSTGSLTFNAAGGDSQDYWAWSVIEVPDARGVLQSKTGSSSTTALTITLDNALETGSRAIGGVYMGDQLTSPGAGWTEISEDGDGTFARLQTQHKAGDASCDWSWSVAVASFGIVVELGALFVSVGMIPILS